MKFDELRSIGYNVADSFGSGIGLLIGFYEMDVYGEAAGSPEGFITVDFLNGTSTGGRPSAFLARAIGLYRNALAEFCEKHGASPLAFRELTARYSIDTFGRRFLVTVADQQGRRSADEYVGTPGRRVRVLDSHGRVRRK